MKGFPNILYEDDFLLVLEKPAGLVVNRSESVKQKTLQDLLEEKYSFKGKDVFFRRSGIVHRLDKDTSGVMVAAKKKEAFLNLQAQFKKRKVLKNYICLVHGKLEPKLGNINLPLARNPENRKKFTVRLGGRKALTFYKRLKFFSAEKLSLVEIELKTGRTHQIRVHLSYLGYPLVSDLIYLGEKRLKKDLLWCSRLFLHAKKLGFNHPKTGEFKEFESKLSKDLQLVLNKLA
jgi:23S rRNA pseudouridine1911/1915/1917 synthase